MKKKLSLAAVAVAGLTLGGLAWTGHLPFARKQNADAVPAASKVAPPIAVTVTKAEMADLAETLLVTGSLIPREEILVGPELEGLRVTEVLADEGDRVKKGQVLARLVSDTIEAQIAQNDAAQARARAAIAQARSNIQAAEARLVEAQNAYNRAKPLTQSGVLSESNMDQRTSAARSAEASLAVSREGLNLAEAELLQVQAQRRDLDWRRGRTDVVAPADGVVSRRVARVGGFAAGAAEPMFRIIAKGEIELDAEVTEERLSALKIGHTATVDVAGAGRITGKIRLLSPEIDKATRLGRVRILLEDNPKLRIGAFATATIETTRSRGLAIPASAILYSREGASVQVVDDGRISTRAVKLGLSQGAMVEVREGLKAGERVVTRSGTFLRDGDVVRPVESAATNLVQAG